MNITRYPLLAILLSAANLCPAQNPELPPVVEPPAEGEPAQPVMVASDEGYLLKQAPLNDVFQTLAKSAGRQYFHNAKIAGPEFNVTGQLNDGNPLQQMEELAFQYGLSLHTKGETVYALTQAQLTQLPGQEFHYQLRYLRPSDIKQILDMVRPMLSPATGIVNFEPKTNTVVVIDAAHRIEQIRGFLHGIDQAKGQIVVETKILRINSTAAEKAGVNWTSSLGDGVPLSVSRDLNSVFGLPSSPASSLPFAEGTNLVLSPVQLDAVLTALNSGNFAHQISNPTLITEDNEQATISIIDRVPIITTTTTANTSGGNPTVTEDVRYKISPDDKTIDQDADKQREIGISMVVTPTLLPDGTVRMKLRPRSAQIVDEVISVATGNKYPRVTESMVESFARVPNGYSLVVGGFYGEAKLDRNTKVPLLGDIPVINFFFKSKDMRKEQTSLVFVVTPRSYDPTSGCATNRAGEMVQQGTELEPNWADPANPGPGHEPNLRRSIRGARPQQAPYYPLPGESTAPSPPPAPSKYPFARSKR